MRSKKIGSTWAASTKREISIERESSRFVSASISSSSTSTNWPFATSQPLTISSGPRSRSCTGHHRFCLIGEPQSRWSIRKDTSDARAAGFVAGASPTGIETSPKLIEPFHVVRMCTFSVEGPNGFALPRPIPCP